MRWTFIAAGAAVLAAIGWLIVSMTRGVDHPLSQHVANAPEPEPARAVASADPTASSPSARSASEPAGRSPLEIPSGSPAEAGPTQLDLSWLQARLPQNRYWTMAAPTDDVEIAKQRADYARRQNDLYGKVLSGTGTDPEIAQYFDERTSVLTDYAEVARVALAEGGDQLSEHDRNLFQLALKMDQDRLDALSRERDDAMARKRLQEHRRADWKGQQ